LTAQVGHRDAVLVLIKEEHGAFTRSESGKSDTLSVNPSSVPPSRSIQMALPVADPFSVSSTSRRTRETIRRSP
jgi:hypothetical protein